MDTLQESSVPLILTTYPRPQARTCKPQQPTRCIAKRSPHEGKRRLSPTGTFHCCGSALSTTADVVQGQGCSGSPRVMHRRHAVVACQGVLGRTGAQTQARHKPRRGRGPGAHTCVTKNTVPPPGCDGTRAAFNTRRLTARIPCDTRHGGGGGDSEAARHRRPALPRHCTSTATDDSTGPEVQPLRSLSVK